jgi:hypothetical protein
MTISFVDAALPVDDIPPDVGPELSDVEYPCEVCGREAGPYGGRGRKPTRCGEHKRNKSSVKVTGNSTQLASQATAVLVQLNGLLAMGAMAVGMFNTASAIAQANTPFEEQARAALATDPDLCRLILKTGKKSAKLSLGLAYVGMGIAVGPVAVMEAREKQRERAERKASQDDA